MHKCSHIESRKDFCYTCVQEVKGNQGQAVEQLTKRLNFIWRKAGPELRGLMLESETRYPIIKAQILTSIPVEGELMIDYKNALDKAIDLMILFRQDFPDCWIGPVNGSFIIYSKPINTESLVTVLE